MSRLAKPTIGDIVRRTVATDFPQFAGVELVTNIFGYWPDFHDAEVLWLRLNRRTPDDGVGPTLEFAIHCFEMTDEIAPSGHYVLRKHTLVHFRFREVTKLDLDGFNHQNAIMSLDISDEAEVGWERPLFRVLIDPSYGLGGSFHSPYPEIISATACNERGEVHPS